MNRNYFILCALMLFSILFMASNAFAKDIVVVQYQQQPQYQQQMPPQGYQQQPVQSYQQPQAMPQQQMSQQQNPQAMQQQQNPQAMQQQQPYVPQKLEDGTLSGYQQLPADGQTLQTEYNKEKEVDPRFKKIEKYEHDKTPQKTMAAKKSETFFGVPVAKFMQRRMGKISMKNKPWLKKFAPKDSKKYIDDEKPAEPRKFLGIPDENGNRFPENYYPEIPALGLTKDREDGRPKRVNMRALLTTVDFMRDSGMDLPEDLEKEMLANPQEAGKMLWDAQSKLTYDHVDPQQIVPDVIKRIEKQSGMKYKEMVEQSYEQLSGVNPDEEDRPCPTCNKPRSKSAKTVNGNSKDRKGKKFQKK